MKTILALTVLVGLAATTLAYSTEHDDLDIAAIVADKNELQKFIDCFTEKAPCTKLTQDFKSKLPEVVREACEKCNPIQKQKLKIFLDGLNEKFPEEYNALKKQFDPTGKLFEALNAALAKA
ncbi:Ejaculatory bulb-specific protein 3 [Papilio machaon]|uniref:Ejaculatory bulb-specific protein 3 n=1 Tax=Papilio machaon TaxID=76193 RepID=A0A194QVV3_PAPMA|nr:Ejaculatory bulb-specific protein 3 [Papilio machaon]